MRCIKKLKRKGIKNPWGICIASTGQYPHKSKKIKRRLK
jgi:hypothetical protein